MAVEGSSLIVPCVQELVAKENPVAVPSRYVRQDQDVRTNRTPTHNHQIPVIDMKILLSDEAMSSELANLHSACKDWGFFQLINHGVSASLLEKVKTQIVNLFNMPMEEKKKLWQLPEDIEGFGQAFVKSEDQILDWCDLFNMVTQPVDKRKSHIFSNLPPSFRETMETYSSEVKSLAMTVLEYMGKALQMKGQEITEIFEDGHQSMRMNYYPKCPEPEKVIGLTPHSDASGLTILLQVNEVEGLQIKKDGKWIPVKPLPDAFVVNIGDLLEIISNGTYRSIEHSATVNSEKERFSIATFYSPKHDVEIGPLANLTTDKTPPLFGRVRAGEYLRCLFGRELRSKSLLDDFRIRVVNT